MTLADFGLLPFKSGTTAPGDRFGRLTVLFTGRPPTNFRYQAVVQCDCGSPPKAVRLDNLISGLVIGCGCVQHERSTKHGLHRHPLYDVWHHMMRRCTNPKDSHYFDYGGRGIQVCERWQDVRHFVADLESLYQPGLEIDRIDNDGNYEPRNVRFVTRRANCGNRRSARLITYNGKTQSLTEWAEETGINRGTLWTRLVDWKWDAERALCTPPASVKDRMAKARNAKHQQRNSPQQ
jgi:hypothetical protein